MCEKFFTKRIKGFKNLTYLCRLAILNQPTLQFRLSRSDFICLFKILNNFTNAILTNLLNVLPIILSDTHYPRDNAFKHTVPKPGTDFLKFSSVYKVIKCWNNLPSFVRDTPSIAVFKKRLPEYKIDHVI